jgi:geranylgeranyl pyrophosphate synthase
MIIDPRIDPWLDRVAKQIEIAGDLSALYPNSDQAPKVVFSGKRVRARLLLMIADVLGVLNDRAVAMAAGLEMVHNASLLHDDVVDEAKTRRGVGTLHQLEGNRLAIMAGDVCFARSMAIFCQSDQLDIYRAVSRCVEDLSQGQMAECEQNTSGQNTIDRYFWIADRKTGSLICLSLEVPGILAGLPKEKIDALKNAGMWLGRAFQVADDLLDMAPSNAGTGKDVFNDLRQGKRTYPYLVILKNPQTNSARLIQNALESGKIDEKSLLAAIQADGLLTQIQDDLAQMIEKAKYEILKVIPKNHFDRIMDVFQQIAFRSK